MRKNIKIRQATEKDVSTISKTITEWLEWKVPRELSIERAVENKELLVADRKGRVIGFVHYVMHEDIVDGGLNAFITCFYVAPEFRNQRIGSLLLDRAVKDATRKGAVGIETSTASPDARRLYERHNFKQFMGKWTMGEVFLELDTRKASSTQNQGTVKRTQRQTPALTGQARISRSFQCRVYLITKS